MDIAHPSQRLENPFLHYGILALIFGVGLVTLLSHTLFHYGHDHNDVSTSSSSLVASYPPCPAKPAHSYTFTITDKAIEPASVDAQRCDELIFANNKTTQASPAFGPHINHYDYPGFNEELLAPKQSQSLRLYQAGTFPIHDHFDDALQATIVIKN